MSFTDVDMLILKLGNATQGLSADSINQDQTQQNVQSDLGSTLSEKKTFFAQNKYGSFAFCSVLPAPSFHPKGLE